MLSPLLEASYTFGGDKLSLGCALQLPSVVAAELDARHAQDDNALAQAERFAMTDYLTTLAGALPKGEAARAFYGRIAQMTGLSVETVEKARGCVRDAYLDHRREKDGKELSPYDATFAVDDPFPESDRRRGPDPVLDGFVRALSGLFVDYVRNDLGFKTDITYALLNSEVTGKWNWERGGRGSQPGVSNDIRELLALNPSFRLLVAHGRSDLVTPYGVSRYLLDHIPAIGGADRVQLRTYAGGHMFYFDPAQRRAFTRDAKVFYQRAE
jgi:carboxypeptidase C (cathepsin A)